LLDFLRQLLHGANQAVWRLWFIHVALTIPQHRREG
jgi:hypothetical protein